MGEFFHQFILAFVPLFVAVDPIGLLPLYIGLTDGLERDTRQRILVEALITATATSIGFVFFGDYLLHFLGVTTHDFQIAGGILLLVISVLDIITSLKPSRQTTPIAGSVPLGIPLIAGPAVLATLLILVRSQGPWPTLLALVVNIVLVGAVLHGSRAMVRVLGAGGSKAVSKVANLILAAFAVMMIRQGVEGIIRMVAGH